MKKIDVVQQILGERYLQPPQNNFAQAFAPTNIALVKYWGKRNQELNLPVTSSLSISLRDKGAEVSLTINNKDKDDIFLNGHSVDVQSSFAKRLVEFLNLFRPYEDVISLSYFFNIEINSNIPIAAGLASSACGFASIVKALNNLYGWDLSPKELSILARLGSGSASRSLWDGFVEWHQGSSDSGGDSHGESLETEWKELCVGLLIMDAKEKKISSREAMQRTIETSKLYAVWPEKVAEDLILVRQAIKEKNFELFGKTAESNALAMHATMMSAWPPVNFSQPETLQAMHLIWNLRAEGLLVYFTQDAGPNLKLLFVEREREKIQICFPKIEIVLPF